MIKLNHKHPLVIDMVNSLIKDVLKNTRMEDFTVEERQYDILVKGTYKGYRFTYSRDKETTEVTVLECWQLFDCEDPIFIA